MMVQQDQKFYKQIRSLIYIFFRSRLIASIYDPLAGFVNGEGGEKRF